MSVTARKADLAGAKTHATSVSASKTPDTSHSVSIGGTFSANTLLGSVIASIDTSTVTTHGTGSVILNAQDDSAADSRAELSATSSPGSVSFDSLGIAAGPSIAFNSIGWSFGNFALETVNTLLDTQFGDSEEPWSPRPPSPALSHRGRERRADGPVSGAAQCDGQQHGEHDLLLPVWGPGRQCQRRPGGQPGLQQGQGLHRQQHGHPGRHGERRWRGGSGCRGQFGHLLQQQDRGLYHHHR